MQRQAVPLLKPEAPIVGTGIEELVALEIQEYWFIAEEAGVVDYVDATKIVVKYDQTDEDELVTFDSDITKHII